MTLSAGKWPLLSVLILVMATVFAVTPGRSVAEEEQDPAATRERALERRNRLQKILDDYFAKYPEADLNQDGQLTHPERTKHVASLYRVKTLQELGDRIRFKGDIEYARVDEVSLTLDLYLPPSTDQPTKPPLVTWFHGGGWRGGGKEQCLVAWLATEGYAVASIEFRSTLQAAFPANIHDCKGAIRWLRANAAEYGFDARKIGTSGASAGGHLAAILGTSAGVEELEGNVGGNLDQSTSVQAILDMSGVIRIAEWPKTHEGLSVLLGLAFSESDGAYELARLCSPDSHLTPDDPPLLILHGEIDKSVPLQQSRDFHTRYKEAGLDATLRVLPRTGHAGPRFTDAPRRQLIKAFYDKHLGPE